MAPQYKFEDILYRNSTRAVLMNFLKEEHGEENLQFWESIYLYKGYAQRQYDTLLAGSDTPLHKEKNMKDPKHAAAVHKSKYELQKLCNQVYVKFLSQDSPYEINIPKKEYNQVVNTIHGKIILIDEEEVTGGDRKKSLGKLGKIGKYDKEKKKIEKSLVMKKKIPEDGMMDDGIYTRDDSSTPFDVTTDKRMSLMGSVNTTTSSISSNNNAGKDSPKAKKTSVSNSDSTSVTTQVSTAAKCTQEDYDRIEELVHAFDKAQKHISKLMETDTYRRFVKSDMFEEVEDIMYKKEKKQKKKERMGKIGRFLKGEAGTEDDGGDNESMNDDDLNKGSKYDYNDILKLMG